MEQKKRGRPQLKPGYDVEKNKNELLEKAATFFEVPYDDRVFRPSSAPTLTFVAEQLGTSRMRARKLLITAGVYSTAISRKIQKLYEEGAPYQEIYAKTGVAKSAVKSYLPYIKGIYKLEDPTLNAEQSKRYQNRRKAFNLLAENLNSENLWNAILAFANYHFKTKDGKRITYKVEGESINFGDRIFTRSDIERALSDASMCDEKLSAVFNRFGVVDQSLITGRQLNEAKRS